MTDHASDCLLSSAPALQPTRCTCGASPAFKMFGYDGSQDMFRWTEHSRESLVAQTASAALARLYRPTINGTPRVRTSLLIHRALLDDFVPAELEAISTAWETLVAPPEEEWLQRLGIPDVFANLDLSPLDPALRERLVQAPTEDEVKASLAPWCEFWAKDWRR